MKAYGLIRFPLNFFSTKTSNFVSELISKSTGLPNPSLDTDTVREFFPDIPFRVDDSFNSLPASLRLIARLADLAKDLGLKRSIVLIDKLDEDARLERDAEKIAEFVRGVITKNQSASIRKHTNNSFYLGCPVRDASKDREYSNAKNERRDTFVGSFVVGARS